MGKNLTTCTGDIKGREHDSIKYKMDLTMLLVVYSSIAGEQKNGKL